MANLAIVEACLLAYTGFEKNQREPLLKFLHENVVFDFPQSLARPSHRSAFFGCELGVYGPAGTSQVGH